VRHDPAVEQATATIEVHRSEDDARDRGRSYRIEIDGRRVGKLRRGETAKYPVTPGTHTVRARIDWTGSPALPVEVSADAPARVVVGPAGLPYEFWLAIGDRFLTIAQD
jgi:hypothetical protein